MKKATFIKSLPAWKGDAALYRLDVPLDGNDYIVVSAVNVFTQPETYIFPANQNGDVFNMLELEGSFQGDLNHKQALRNAGYVID